MPGSFYNVACPDCDNEQIVFGKAAGTVNCAVCGHTLAKSTGGEAVLEGEVVDTVERRSTSSQTRSDDTVEAR